MTAGTEVIANIEELLAVLPKGLRLRLERHENLEELLEVVIDLGRPIEARFPGTYEIISEDPATQDDLDHVVSRIGEFGEDNRAGIERTLHRISAIRNRTGRVIGLTCRVGRAVYGTIDIIRDVVESGKSILLLGRPGVGKTTMLREVARVLADDLSRRVVVVDTSNEIAGDGDIPHPAIGRARRMQVRTPDRQHAVMIEAVENHMPEVIVIDEIGTQEDAFAARTIAERGVQLIGTAHGNNLDNLMANPTLCDLIGGIQAVTLSDEEARRRGTQKTVLERKAPPTFEMLVEILDLDRVALYRDVARTVDRRLLGDDLRPEVRRRGSEGEIVIVQSAPEAEAPVESGPLANLLVEGGRIKKLFVQELSVSKVEKAVRELRIPCVMTDKGQEADVVLMLKAVRRRTKRSVEEPISPTAKVIEVRSNTYGQIYEGLREAFDITRTAREEFALQEAEQALKRVIQSHQPVELTPQNAYIRRLQHELAAKYDVRSMSVGHDPRRRVKFAP
ncbi:MAG: R3H domain-containing nucleic acid-binding protein [Candidatus Zipacnadales bacterium]